VRKNASRPDLQGRDRSPLPSALLEVVKALAPPVVFATLSAIYAAPPQAIA